MSVHRLALAYRLPPPSASRASNLTAKEALSQPNRGCSPPSPWRPVPPAHYA
ncbi:MAG: hypothetical protein M5R42_09595 [Rhodocyclaceae bacterium]|nr:hypothetical protein [Rhodocyclaceae bacterium]